MFLRAQNLSQQKQKPLHHQVCAAINLSQVSRPVTPPRILSSTPEDQHFHMSACVCHHVNTATLPLPSTVGNNESLTSHLLRRASHHPVLPTWGPSAPTPAARLGFMDHSVNTIFTSSPGTFYPLRSLFHHLPVIVVPPPTPLPSANPSLTISPHHSHHFLHSRSSLKRLVFASTQLEAMFKCYEPTVTQTLKN